MKIIFSQYYILVAFIFCQVVCQAQQEIPPIGFVRMINGIGHGNGNAKFIVDQEDIYPTGYKLGQDSGAMSLNQGSHSFTVCKNGVTKGTTKLDVVTGETTTVIAFAELIPPVNKEDPPTWTIKLLRLKQKSIESGYGLTLISVADAPETPVSLTVGAKGTIENHTLTRLKFTNVHLGATRGEVFISEKGKPLTTVSPDTPGNYVVVLYDGENGETAAIYFFDSKFTVAG